MENLQELTECCICTEIFTDPRMLPCIHTFCLKCLQQTAVKNEIKTGEKMPCPFCRREFVIPTEGISGLQKNFFINRLVEITKLSKPIEKAPYCEICIEDNETEACEIPTATNYCIQCRKNICNLCCRYHNKFSDSKDHELLPLGCRMNKESIRKYAAQSCDKHNKKKFELFCSDCKEVICMMCFVENHRNHNCTDIETSADSFQKQILDTIERVSTFSNDAVSRYETLSKEKSAVLNNVAREETVIVTRGKFLKDLVEKCTKSLLEELNSIKQSHLKEMETAKEEIEFHKGILESFKEYCRELTSKGSAAEICRSALNINLREVELKQIHELHNQGQIKSAEVSFEKFQLEELLNNENIVGKIKVEKKTEAEDGKVKADETSDDGQDEVSIVSSVQLDVPSGHVRGVTKLLHNIYVLCSSCDSIYAFEDQSPFRLQKEIKINEIKNPKDIIAIEESKCLYVADMYYIWKITADNHRVTKWMKRVNNSFALSASNDGHLMVLTSDLESRFYVEIFKSDATRVCHLFLPTAIESPCHVIQTSNGEFIVSHRKNGYGLWVISRLTSDGRNIISQSKPIDDRVSLLNYPSHLSLDSIKNRLFVAKGDRVSVFDSISLNLKNILPTPDQVQQKLHYDAKKRQLIMGQWNGKVTIYEIN